MVSEGWRETVSIVQASEWHEGIHNGLKVLEVTANSVRPSFPKPLHSSHIARFRAFEKAKYNSLFMLT